MKSDARIHYHQMESEIITKSRNHVDFRDFEMLYTYSVRVRPLGLIAMTK